jgi:hypothetical protein
MAFITRWPNEPATQATNAIANAWPGANGVTPASKAAQQAARRPHATHQAGQLKLPLMAGAAGARRNRRAAKNCATMQVCTTSTRKITKEMHCGR